MQGEGWDLPDGVAPWSAFHWFKIGSRSGLDCVILSEQPYWYVGHFYGNRMWPCQAPGCQVCEEGVGRQIRFCFAVVERTTRRVGLLEVSDSVGQLIRSWIARNEGLRGMHVFFTRHSHSIKSRMEVEFCEQDKEAWFRELEVPDPRMALELTWTKMRTSAPKSTTERVEDFKRGGPSRRRIAELDHS